jgi:HK97 family phage prohead protease
MEHVNFALKIKSVGEAGAGTFSGFASTYGNLDLQDDVVDAGAFTKSLMENNSQFPLLWQHDQRNPIGIVTARDTTRGLEVSGELVLETSKGAEAYALLKRGVVRGLSVGFDAIKKAYRDGARHLQEIKLFEVSLVTIGANPMAQVLAVKANDDDALEQHFQQFENALAECRKSWR